MSILKHVKKNGYVQISNELAQTKKLSYEAIGVLVNLLSRPENWIVHKSSFRNEYCGEVVINRIFKELKEAGYLFLYDIREDGKITDRAWVVSDEPIKSSEEWLETLENLNAGEPQMRKPQFEEKGTVQIKNNNINKEESLLEKDSGKKSPAKSIDYSPEFLNMWDYTYPHTSDRGSKTQTYKHWCNLLKEGKSTQELLSAAHNYYKHCSIKKESFRYRCSNFYGEKRYFENFMVVNLTTVQQEATNEQRNNKQPTGAETLNALFAFQREARRNGDGGI
jgi:hypothetical protein